MSTDYHGTPIIDVPRLVPCIVVYPNGQTRRASVKYAKLQTVDEGLNQLKADHAAWVADGSAAEELLSQWHAHQAAQ